MKDGFVFYHSFYEALQAELDPLKRLEAYEAIIEYALEDIEPDGLTGLGKAVFTMARPQIDANTKRHENGCKGGRPKKPMVIEDKNQWLENEKPKEKDKEKEKEKDKEKYKEKNKEKKENAPRKKYGEYKNVLLSDDDYQKLIKQFPNDYNERINSLSFYMQSTHKTYKDHLATIRRWAWMDSKRIKENAAKSQGIELQDYDFEEIEKMKLAGG